MTKQSKTTTTARNTPLPDLWQRFADLGLGVTREKKRSWLLERIHAEEARRAGDEATPDDAVVDPTPDARLADEPAPDAPPADEPAPDDTATDAAPEAPTKLSKMTTDELVALYGETLGRPTGSTHRGYLIWKIREAQKGRVPVGPTQRTTKRDPTVKTLVLPLALSEPLVDTMDAAWKRLGFKSRMAFLRHAIGKALAMSGEHDAADAFRRA